MPIKNRSIAVLHGDEGTFPYDLISYLENKAPSNISIKEICIGSVYSSDNFEYDVIIDRISHCIPFYREVMRLAFLTGAYVISNPFRTNPEKFFANSVALRIGVNVPETVILPSKEWADYIKKTDLANLKYPLDWEGIIKTVGFPAVLKPVYGGGWRDVNIVNSLDELFYFYDKSGKKLMMLQEFINYSDYIRAFVVGKKYVRLSIFEPLHKKDITLKAYPEKEISLNGDIINEMKEKSCLLCDVLDYDVNSVEWAIKDGKAYAIDFCNQVPDARKEVINNINYKWFVSKLGDFAIECALEKPCLNIWKSFEKVIR